MAVIVADANGTTDGSAFNLVSRIECSLPIVLVAWTERFVFNEALLSVKDYILVCFCEYGWDHDFDKTGTHFWGENSELFPRYYNNDWVRFDDWVKGNPPKLTFKRELLKKDLKDGVQPIEYPANFNPPEPDSVESFYSRPLDVFNCWGLSNPIRPRVHAAIWEHAGNNGYVVCDNLYNLSAFMSEEKNPRKWVTVNIPHYGRYPIEAILGVGDISKCCLSLFGAGRKCFRTTGEAPLNSLMICFDDKMAYQFPWVNGENCVMVDGGGAVGIIRALEKAFGRDATLTPSNYAYNAYVNGVSNCRNYYLPNYVNHLQNIINGL